MDLRVNDNFIIPSKELKWRFSRSSGPGGQGVNTTDSRVELTLDIKRSSIFGPFLKKKLLDELKERCVNGCISIVVSEERSQYQNRQLALTRLGYILRDGLKPSPRSRKGTKPTRSSTKRRIAAKKRRGELKKKRQIKPSIED